MKLARIIHETRVSGCASRRAAGAGAGRVMIFLSQKLPAPDEEYSAAQAFGPYASLPATLATSM